MIAIALLAAAQAGGLPAPVTEEEIIVTARKMQWIEVDMKAPRRNGVLTIARCRVTKPSGHAELDAIPCGVAHECIADAPASRKLLARCVEDRSQGRLDAVAAAWRQAAGIVR